MIAKIVELVVELYLALQKPVRKARDILRPKSRLDEEMDRR